MSTTWINRGHLYSPHVTPVLADGNWVVDNTNGNGLGVRNVKGQAIQNVFMHTTATPGLGLNGVLNPNPAPGVILIQLADNYTRGYGGFTTIVSPLSGTSITVSAGTLTLGTVYVITSVGTSTLADFQALGLPKGITPAVGATFVAAAASAGSGSGTVQAASASGIDHVEVIGDVNTMLGPVPQGGSPNYGGWIMMQCLLNTTLTAPANGTVLSTVQLLNQSSVLVKGE